MKHIPRPSSLNFKFYSANGTGNTFLIADIHSKKISADNIKAPLLDALHAQNKDSGLILEKVRYRVYKMRIIEKDGSESFFCGNGARVLAHYLHKTIGITLAEFETCVDERLIFGKNGTEYFVECGAPITLKTALVDNYKFHNFNVCGEPHYITEDFFDKHKLIEYAERFNNNHSTNVSCINNQDIITYERGVNDITQSCGSACVAATQLRLKNTKIEFDWDRMPWHCLGGTNFVETKTFTLYGPTYVEDIERAEKFKKNEIPHPEL